MIIAFSICPHYIDINNWIFEAHININDIISIETTVAGRCIWYKKEIRKNNDRT